MRELVGFFVPAADEVHHPLFGFQPGADFGGGVPVAAGGRGEADHYPEGAAVGRLPQHPVGKQLPTGGWFRLTATDSTEWNDFSEAAEHGRHSISLPSGR